MVNFRLFKLVTSRMGRTFEKKAVCGTNLLVLFRLTRFCRITGC